MIAQPKMKLKFNVRTILKKTNFMSALISSYLFFYYCYILLLFHVYYYLFYCMPFSVHHLYTLSKEKA